jgi:hypothetical protein
MSQVQTLNPIAKLVMKILQHIKSKLDDYAEVRLYTDDNEIYVSTYMSEVKITRNSIEFKRVKPNNTIIVQRMKNIQLSDDIFKLIRDELVNIIVHDAEPNYDLISKISEKTSQ